MRISRLFGLAASSLLSIYSTAAMAQQPVSFMITCNTVGILPFSEDGTTAYALAIIIPKSLNPGRKEDSVIYVSSAGTIVVDGKTVTPFDGISQDTANKMASDSDWLIKKCEDKNARHSIDPPKKPDIHTQLVVPRSSPT